MSKTLEAAASGETVMVTEIGDAEMALAALRLGIAQGQVLTLTVKIPGGPVVVKHNGMELALGRDLCRQIYVTETMTP